MIVKVYVGGPFATNSYLVADDRSGEALVIDSGGAAADLLAALAQGRMRLAAIVNTHGHFDHVSGNLALREATGAPLLMHAADARLASMAGGLAAFVAQTAVNSPPPDRLLDEGDEIRLGSLSFRVMHTPGHTPGGISLYSEGAVFCGDLIVDGASGRTDLPGCSEALLLRSIREKILTLPDITAIYPGHGPPSTVAIEQRNPRLRERRP